MKTIAIIGAGTLGNGIAHTFAQSGFTVKLIDFSEKSLDIGMDSIFTNLERMVAKGTITEEEKFKTINNIITYTDIKDGVVAVDLVIDATIENVELKLHIFKELNEICSHSTILLTQNNFIDPISKVIAHSERLIGLNFLLESISNESRYNSNAEINQFILNLSQKLDKSALEYYDFGKTIDVN